MKIRSIHRRRFLIQGAAVAGMAALGAPRTSRAVAQAPPSTTEAPPPALPPPFGKEVYYTRMEQARAGLAGANAAALVETPGTNLSYLTGLSMGHSERLTALVLPASGQPVFICPAFERDLVASAPAGIEEIRVWEEDEDPFALLAKCLKDADVGAKPIAVGGSVWYDDFVRINKTVPKATFVSTTAIVGVMRERKTSQEIACMKAAAEIVERAVASALKDVKEGIRESDLAAAIIARIREMGAAGSGIVQFGPRSAVPHNPTGDARLALRDVILIDFGAQVNGYWSDISRPAVLGKATERMKLIHSTIRRVQDRVLEVSRPNMSCAGLDHMARSLLVDRGFRKYLRHRLGHGIGLDGHEPPYLSGGYIRGLVAGHVVTVEPGVYTPGEYGIRIEDMMEITETGARWLSTPPVAMIEV